MKTRLISIMLCTTLVSVAQDYELKSTVNIYKDLLKLQRGTRVLYLAAHPDDENTRLIAWLENEMNAQTAYLSLTRGQGGQNLIGDEKGDALGVIRSYELLEARKLDGGQQFFTRAVDFGYSKSAEESFEKWGKEEVLHDVVWVIRKFRPHVIITRFPPTRRAGHGHHEASALLAEEAFELAADPKAFPEQLAHASTWQVQTLYHNASSWWDPKLDEMSQAQLLEAKMQRIDAGHFDELSGFSHNEVAGLARSKHRCQAFGTSRDRGPRIEYLKWVKGDWVEDITNGIENIFAENESMQEAIGYAVRNFNFLSRDASLKTLHLAVSPILDKDIEWKEAEYFSTAYREVVRDLIGVRVEASVPQEPIIAGEAAQVFVEVYNSSANHAKVAFNQPGIDTSFSLEPNAKVEFKRSLSQPLEISNPYWLEAPHGYLYEPKDYKILGEAKRKNTSIDYTVRSQDLTVSHATELHRKWRDRSIGELVEPLLVVPPAHIVLEEKAKVVAAGKRASIKVRVVAKGDLTDCVLIHSLPQGWSITSASAMDIDLRAGQEKVFEFDIVPSTQATAAVFELQVVKKGERAARSKMATVIDYEHIPYLVIHSLARVDLAVIDMSPATGKILYVEGSGDEVDEALENIGYEVSRQSLAGLSVEDILEFKAVVIGIRAMNQNQELAANLSVLHEYVKRGGKMIVQYTTTYSLLDEAFAPYTLKLSRNRVTEEDSPVEFIQSNHPILNSPNKITERDFDNWVQERGLYFAGEWSEEYQPIIRWSDTGEEPVDGGLLAAEFGDGQFIYTGISFFRELPAGVPGAYRLFQNLIEY